VGILESYLSKQRSIPSEGEPRLEGPEARSMNNARYMCPAQ
jgi:hypothetical protein